MRRVAVVLLLLGLSAASATAAPASPPVFEGCLTGPVVRPASIVVACADGNFYVSRLRWSAWTATAATATGTAHQNDCKPYCAAGHFHTYPVRVTATKRSRCGAAVYYARIEIFYPGRRPAEQPAHSADPLPC